MRRALEWERYCLSEDPFFPLEAERRVERGKPVVLVGYGREIAEKMLGELRDRMNNGEFYGSFLYGLRGIGKSAILLNLMQKIKEKDPNIDVKYIRIDTPCYNLSDLISFLSDELGVRKGSVNSVEALTGMLREVRPIVLMLDQFENFDPEEEELENFRRVLREVTGLERVGLIISVTSEAYASIIPSEEHRSYLRTYDAYEVRPLAAPEEAEDLLRTLMDPLRTEERCRGKLYPFKREAVKALLVLSRGIPGILMKYCSELLREGLVSEVEEIGRYEVLVLTRLYEPEWIDYCRKTIRTAARGQTVLANGLMMLEEVVRFAGGLEEINGILVLPLYREGRKDEESIRSLAKIIRRKKGVGESKIIELFTGVGKLADSAILVNKENMEFELILVRYVRRRGLREMAESLERVSELLESVVYGGREYSLQSVKMVLLLRGEPPPSLLQRIKVAGGINGITVLTRKFEQCADPALYGATHVLSSYWEDMKKESIGLEDLPYLEFQKLLRASESVLSRLGAVRRVEER